MGDYAHRAVLVTGPHGDVTGARGWLSESNRYLSMRPEGGRTGRSWEDAVKLAVVDGANGFATLLVAPSGGKSGGALDLWHSALVAEFVAWLRSAPSLSWVVVEYGECPRPRLVESDEGAPCDEACQEPAAYCDPERGVALCAGHSERLRPTCAQPIGEARRAGATLARLRAQGGLVD